MLSKFISSFIIALLSILVMRKKVFMSDTTLKLLSLSSIVNMSITISIAHVGDNTSFLFN